jgi:glutamyl-tRNA synthetase
MTTRVRFAPSPTGDPHLGNIRTAVFDYLFARKTGGAFILRVEDTDQARLNPESVQRMYEALAWLGIEPDEGVHVKDGVITQVGNYGPYVQSERMALYAQYAQVLLDSGMAYRCFATAEELQEMRDAQQAAGLPPKYDRRYRDLPRSDSDARAAAGEPFVIRQAIPLQGTVIVHDLIRGEVSFACADLDDHVLIKKDGFPTYQFANVVDDHLMEITHVLRGYEYIPSAPKNVLLYQAFGWTPPLWVHVPWVLGGDKTKLSKRHGAETVLVYRDQGYLPEAILNALAYMGWNPGTEEEFMSKSELEQRFSIERINKAPAVFDVARLEYVNGWYIRAMPLPDLVERVRSWIPAEWPMQSPNPAMDAEQYLSASLGLIQERLKRLSEIPDLLRMFFVAPEPSEALRAMVVPKKETWETIATIVQLAIDHLDQVADQVWESAATLEENLRAFALEHEIKPGNLFWPLRAALSGAAASSGVFDVLWVLGKTESIARLRRIL